MSRQYWFATAYRRNATPADICAGPFPTLEEAWRYLRYHYEDDSSNQVFVNINDAWYFAAHSINGLSLHPYQ